MHNLALAECMHIWADFNATFSRRSVPLPHTHVRFQSINGHVYNYDVAVLRYAYFCQKTDVNSEKVTCKAQQPCSCLMRMIQRKYRGPNIKEALQMSDTLTTKRMMWTWMVQGPSQLAAVRFCYFDGGTFIRVQPHVGMLSIKLIDEPPTWGQLLMPKSPTSSSPCVHLEPANKVSARSVAGSPTIHRSQFIQGQR